MIWRFVYPLLLVFACNAYGHEPSRSLIALDVDGQELRGRWDIALRDLEDAIGLDANGDSAITWREVGARHEAIVAYAAPRLRVSAGDADCSLRATPAGVETHGGGAFAVLTLAGRCSAASPRLAVTYGLLFEIDRAHRAIVTVTNQGGTASAIASFDSPRVELAPAAEPWWLTARRFLVEGVHHILEGYDHLAFVALLLLPIALARRGRGDRAGARAVVIEILRVVTAFTAAHSLTLALAASGQVAIPTRFVELGIAASVLIAAVLNIVPKAPRIGAKLAFAFGLLHGFGFASALGELPRGGGSLLAPLGGFNLGVELGQLAVVAVLLPLLLIAARSMAARIAVNALGSAACGALAIFWIAERWVSAG